MKKAETKKPAVSPVDALILAIAQQHLHGARGEDQLVTLEARNSDSLDFTEQAVWSLKNALTAAFAAGRDFEAKRSAAEITRQKNRAAEWEQAAVNYSNQLSAIEAKKGGR